MAARTALVVDDDALTRRSLGRALEQLGCEVHLCDTGRRALELARRLPSLDLAFIDISLPGLDGVAVARRLLERLPNTRIIHVSGFDADTLYSWGMEPKYGEFLRKPLGLQTLRRILEEVPEGPGDA